MFPLSLNNTIFIIIFLTAVTVFTRRFIQLIGFARLGKPSKIADHIPWRLKTVGSEVFAHSKMFRDFKPGLLHFFIFYGFCIISIGTLEHIVHGIFGGSFRFLGETTYNILYFFIDLFCVLVFFSVIWAAYRRLIVKPKRLVINKHATYDALFILFLIGLLMAAQLIFEGAWINLDPESAPTLMPFGKLTGALLTSLGMQDSLETVKETAWWVHILTVLFFLCYLPYSKHLHIVTAIPNIFFKRIKNRGALYPINLEDEKVTSYGAGSVEELTWKDNFDAYVCTECGRCNEFCPTANTDKPLKPRTLIMDLRHHLVTYGEEKRKGVEHQTLLTGGAISRDVIWDCTTCGACVEACPVDIEHVDKIIDMRRNLVLMKGEMEPEVQKSMNNWESYSNPWGLPPTDRGKWMENLGVTTMAEKKDVDYLYFVGCAASFDERNQKIAKAIVKILQTAKVSFSVLGKEEKCNGETARRLGNEYLGQMLIKSNIEIFKKYNVKKIITSCPHCFNTFKNEYPDFGGNYEVIHHSLLINDLIKEKKLTLKQGANLNVTYHDACYLGRYNQIFEEPREILKSIPGLNVIEMPRNKKQGFCCGAGGGRMWAEETRGTRINVNRVEEAAATGASVVASSCPFCMIMMEDGIKNTNKEASLKPKDIAELVAESLS
ncbi:MAG: hypothetical protein A3F16_06485 [Deltaproteobacteria bacterium RIFCSPHIGHO2_12_FULL_43_9]|nr:MAG: hypothetical protein A3F16_06485 [Deltaproteobacteria bacterium RIFCSPHIGHO2_12_FULL_43_9]